MTPYVADPDFTLLNCDVLDGLRSFEDGSVHCCVTSPPYWGLRDYGADGQIGLEATPELFVARMVEVFREVRRVLRADGTCWLNLGDSYSHGGNGSRDVERWPKQSRNDHRVEHRNAAGGKPKDLVGIPWRVAFALQADGWYLRSDIVWAKPNPMPESVTDRPTKSHEYLFLLTKSARYFYDADAIRQPLAPDSFARSLRTSKYDDPEVRASVPYAAPRPRVRKSGNLERKPNPAAVLGNGDTSHGIPWEDDGTGRNARSVWEIATQPYAEAHFATFPEELPRRCIAAGSPLGGTILDPFMGSGTTALVARKLGRKSVGIELNAEYAALAARRLSQLSLLAEGAA